MSRDPWRDWLRGFGWWERLFLLALALAVVAQTLNWSGLPILASSVLAGVFGTVVLWRLGLRAARRAIWSLKNRLIVAFLLFAFVPIVLIVVLAEAGAWAVAGQVGAYMLNNEYERRITSLRGNAFSLARAAPQARAEAVRRAGFIYRDRYPGLEIVVHDENGQEVRFPEDSTLGVPPKRHPNTAGVLIKDGRFYLWAHAGNGRSEVVLLAPITRNYLQTMVPGLGDVQLTALRLNPDESHMQARLHAPVEGEPEPPEGSGVVPEPENMFDLRVKWGLTMLASIWEDPDRTSTVVLGMVTRIWGVMRVIFSLQQTSSNSTALATVLALCAVLFLVVEVISANIGFKLTRSITSAMENLYEGTQRVREGDLSHRIPVEGDDQLAEVGRSFNGMTENLERLIAAEKEQQRLLADLEIAREVQSQLHPKPFEGLGDLRIATVCTAARAVSGDYFDYQKLDDRHLAIAIGDVAGKGISAALLMATTQSAMRSLLRHCVAITQAAAAPGGRVAHIEHVSPARLVAELNQQLYESTSPEKFATFFFAIYDDESGSLSYTNAGHLPPMLIRGGEVISLDTNGMVVGAFPFATYDESSIRLEPGDLLVCYTDGITEPENEYGEMYGEERLKRLLLENCSKGAEEIAQLVVEDVRKWTSSPDLQDDMTMLISRKER
ncbi:MAG: SpoIIE family protein phosphatase [Bryobacteraceae bacterium]|nr:SpoIIE family protein phosphatase [Bryobacteraceae bacterium]